MKLTLQGWAAKKRWVSASYAKGVNNICRRHGWASRITTIDRIIGEDVLSKIEIKLAKGRCRKTFSARTGNWGEMTEELLSLLGVE